MIISESREMTVWSSFSPQGAVCQSILRESAGITHRYIGTAVCLWRIRQRHVMCVYMYTCG